MSLHWNLKTLFRRRQFDSELDEEVALHLELREQQLLEQGFSAKDARREARKRFGNQTLALEDSRAYWGFRRLEELGADVRYAARSLSHSPGFTFVVAASLALGIGTNVAVFSVVHAMLLRPLPYNEPERIVAMQKADANTGYWRRLEPEDYQSWREENPVLDGMSYWADVPMTVKHDGVAELIDGQLVSASLFPMLGVQPILGRNFLPGDASTSAGAPVILSYRLWERWFEKDPNVIGQSLRLDRESATVIGVMPPGFHFAQERTQLWAAAPSNSPAPNARVVARMKSGIGIEQARVAMEAIAARRAQESPDPAGETTVRMELLEETWFAPGAPLRRHLFVFTVAVGFVLLIACANVAGLLLVRSSSRTREMTTRLALGAGRWRVVRQALTESTLLAAAGGVLGIAVAYGSLEVLLSFNPDNLFEGGGASFPRMNEAAVDLQALGYALLLSLLAGLTAGIFPAFQDSKHNLTAASRGTTRGRRQQRLSSVLVVAQIALALVLLVGAGLMLNSLVRLQLVDVGFDPASVLTFRVDLRGTDYEDKLRETANFGLPGGESPVTNFYAQVLERLRSIPGVEHAAAMGFLPLSHYTFSSHIGVKGRLPADYAERNGWDPETRVRHFIVMGDVFETLNIPLLRGRGFTRQDSAEAHRVAIVDEQAARLHWPGEDPIGKQITLRPARAEASRPLEVVGVVGSIREWNLQFDSNAAVYVPRVQEEGMNSSRLLRMAFAIRTSSEAAALIPSIRAVVAEVDPNIPIYAVEPMERFYLIWTGESRFYALLLTIFAGLGLILAAIGVYGVMAHSAARRTKEMGIRMALGAKSAEVLRAVIRRGVALTGVGVFLGLAASITLARLTGSFGLTSVDEGSLGTVLYGVTPTDPVTLVAVSIVMTTVALLACYVPARRATKVEPAIVLRHE